MPLGLLKYYSERLINKLEEEKKELEKANRKSNK
mgnify:CR=1 FL=1